jgi:hypothetical protein
MEECIFCDKDKDNPHCKLTTSGTWSSNAICNGKTDKQNCPFWSK